MIKASHAEIGLSEKELPQSRSMAKGLFTVILTVSVLAALAFAFQASDANVAQAQFGAYPEPFGALLP